MALERAVAERYLPNRVCAHKILWRDRFRANSAPAVESSGRVGRDASEASTGQRFLHSREGSPTGRPSLDRSSQGFEAARSANT
jgi:hypothetical protein